MCEIEALVDDRHVHSLPLIPLSPHGGEVVPVDRAPEERDGSGSG